MLLYIVAFILVLVVYFKYIRLPTAEYEVLSKYYGDKCWTKGEEKVDESIRPFKISISDEELEDLHRRLDSTRYPTPALEDAKFTYGVNQKFMKEFVEYWRNSYSWREQEKELNKFDHFKTKIEGLDIHFVHVKPETKSPDIKPKPLLICHGWPGSFYEFYKMIPMLTDPTSHGGNETDLFEVIAPSIPGYGFSQASELQGFNTLHCSRIFHKLMQRLGHTKYYVQGGDWGSRICSNMAMMYPSSVKGLHTNMATSKISMIQNLRMLVGSLAPKWFYNSYEANQLFPLKELFKKVVVETGYMHIQATKPDTVGFALSDSPVGLAAYILEKFSSWTDMSGREKSDGGLGNKWTKDEILTNIMIYWWSGNVTSSMRFYKESLLNTLITGRIKIRVPVGHAWCPNEFVPAIKKVLEDKCTRPVSFTYMKEGGHFAAFEVPHLLVEDIRQFVRKVENVKPKRENEDPDLKQTHLDRFEKE